MNKLLYTIGEAASLLGVAVVTFCRWANDKKMPFERTLDGLKRSIGRSRIQ